MKKMAIFAALFALAACSGKGDEIIFDKTLGPRSETQAETLPNTLEGDRTGARHSSETIRGAGMESSDGSD